MAARRAITIAADGGAFDSLGENLLAQGDRTLFITGIRTSNAALRWARQPGNPALNMRFMADGKRIENIRAVNAARKHAIANGMSNEQTIATITDDTIAKSFPTALKAVGAVRCGLNCSLSH